MELELRHMSALIGFADARTMDLETRGRPVTAVYRPVEEQWVLRRGRTLGARLGIYQVLQALPLREWVPVGTLTEREREILPALPAWTRLRRSGRIMRLADVPVRLDLVVTRGQGWFDALGRACVLGPVAPRMAVCPSFGTRTDAACWEVDYHGVGFGVENEDTDSVEVLVRPRTWVPESAAALGWCWAERVLAEEFTMSRSTVLPSS